MITDTIINILIAPIYYIFALFTARVPEYPGGLAIPDDVFQGIQNFIGFACYMFPLRQLLFILILFEFFDNLNVIWAFILRIKSFIPFSGGK